MIKKVALGWIMSLLLIGVVSAQTELAATLEVLETGVSIQRVNTASFIDVTKEAIVGVGDVIQTNDTGRARITFFADGTETELQPNTQYRIAQFDSQGESFQLTVEVLLGQTTQRLGRILDANSSYNINTTGMTLAARGTVFQVRVTEDGQSGLIVTEGVVNASKGEDVANVEPEFGIRADKEGSLSDIVKATTFDQLDSAIDGCVATLKTVDDVSLNVRLSPSADSARVGTISASDVTRLFGTIEGNGWYRIAFRGGYAWVLSTNVTLDKGCAGLRIFTNDTLEDATLFESLGDNIDLNDLPLPEATPEAGS